MAKAFRTAGIIVGAVGVVVATGGLGIPGVAAALGSVGISAGGYAAIATALTLGGSLLAGKPKSPGMIRTASDRLVASIDPRTPRKFIFGGPTALPCDERDA